MLSRGLLRESYHQNQKMLLPARRRINDADFITDRDGERNAKIKIMMMVENGTLLVLC